MNCKQPIDGQETIPDECKGVGGKMGYPSKCKARESVKI